MEPDPTDLSAPLNDDTDDDELYERLQRRHVVKEKATYVCLVLFIMLLLAAALPAMLSISIPIVIRDGMACGLIIISGFKPSSVYGISCSGMILPIVPFCPCLDENLSPITGAMITADNAAYFYTGIQAQYKLGSLNLTPSFAPGYYNEGNGKDLGHALEFKSEVQLSLELPKDSQFGFSYNHLSNASLGDKNPGANSYMFNFFKKF